MRPSSQMLRAKLGVWRRRGGLSPGSEVIFFYLFLVNLFIFIVISRRVVYAKAGSYQRT